MVPTVSNTYNGEAVFNQFMRLRNQLVKAAEIFAKEENLTPVLIPTISRGMDKQLKLPNNVVDVVDRTNRKICDSAADDLLSLQRRNPVVSRF